MPAGEPGPRAAGPSPAPAKPVLDGEAEIPLTPAEDESLRRARGEYVAGRYPQALALYDALLSDFPKRAVFWNDRGVTLDAVGRHAEAERDYRRAIALYPEYELAQRNLSNCLLFQEKEDEALGALQRAVELRPAYEGAWNDLLAILLSRGPTKAEVQLARRLVVKTKSPLGNFVLGVVASEAGRTRAAVRALKAASRQMVEDEELQRELAEDFPRVRAGVEKALGNALFARNDLAGAVDAYRRAIDADPDEEETWNNLGFAYFSAGENDLSIECFRRAVEVNPRYKHAWYNLAYAYQSLDLLELAIVAYDRTLECDPLDEVAWNNRGNAEYNLGRYEGSIPYFEKAVEIRPDYDIAWNNVGNALNKAGRHAEAVPFHERALETNAQFDYAWYALAKSRFHTGDLAGAVRDIERCLQVNPQFDSGWAMKAEILMHLGDLEEALEAAEQGVAANPANDHVHFVEGEILEQLGRQDAAEAAFERAIAIAGESAALRDHVPDAWSTHGEMLLARERLLEARASFEKAAQINPGSLLAREGLVDVMARLGEYREAVLALRDTGRREAPHELLARIRLYLDTGDAPAVAAAADRYREWYGDDAEVRLLEGEAMLAVGRTEEALHALERAARGVEKSLAKERRAQRAAQEQSRKRKGKEKGGSTTNPRTGERVRIASRIKNDEWAEVGEGRRQIRTLQEEGAFLDSFAEEPTGERHLKDQLFRARLLGAAAARMGGNAGDARALLLQAAELLPDRAESWEGLGKLALEAGDLKNARAHFEAAVGAEPESEMGWLGLAETARRQGRLRQAERLAAVARRIAPGHPLTLPPSRAQDSKPAPFT